MKTSPHQDAADVVAELRARVGMLGPQPEQMLRFMNGMTPLLEKSANLIEQQAKALSEARADALVLYQLGADVHICEHCSAWMTDEERARVDVTLCPREAYGSDRFPDEPCFKHRSWLVEADRAESRSFLNSASNKEGAARAKQESSDA